MPYAVAGRQTIPPFAHSHSKPTRLVPNPFCHSEQSEESAVPYSIRNPAREQTRNPKHKKKGRVSGPRTLSNDLYLQLTLGLSFATFKHSACCLARFAASPTLSFPASVDVTGCCSTGAATVTTCAGWFAIAGRTPAG